MSSVLRSFLTAWHFLTAVPLGRNEQPPSERDLARSMSWYPVIGGVLGGVLVLADRVMTPFLALEAVNALLLLILVVLTRGLHMDGLADTVDGLVGGQTPDERLAIMRDGPIGAMGAMALIFSLGLRYAGLASLSSGDRAAILLLMPAVGRWAMVIGAVGVPYARPQGGLGKPFLLHLSRREVVIATAIIIPLLVWALGLTGGIVAFMTLAVTVRLVTLSIRRLCGGMTGDTLGATNELAEVMTVIFAPVCITLSASHTMWPTEFLSLR